MRHFTFLTIVLLCLLLSSCGGKDEPKGNVPLSINDAFIPVSIIVNRSDKAMVEECKIFSNKDMVVQSKSNLPDDPFDSDKTFDAIDFNYNTLLITYYVHTYNLLSCNNYFVRNYTDNTYDWTINMGITGDAVDSFDQLIFTRFAILVPKLQKNADLKVYYGIGNYKWDWN